MIGQEIRAARKRAGMSLREVGDAVGRTGGRVCQIELGIHYQPALADRIMRAIQREMAARQAKDREALRRAG